MAIEHIWENEFAKRYFSNHRSVNFFDYSMAYDKPPYAFSFNGVPSLPFGSLNAIMGQTGQGKSNFAAAIAIAALRFRFGEDCGLRWADTNILPKVLHFDTEQITYESAEYGKRIVSGAGRNTRELYPDFNYIRADEGKSADENREWLMNAVRDSEPNVIIVDGVSDCVRSINEETECKDFIDMLREMAIVYNAVVICIAHQNHGTDKMLGFLGSMLERKATNIWEVIKHKEKEPEKAFPDIPPFFEVKTIKARGKDVGNFTFKMEYNGEYDIPKITFPTNAETIKETVQNNDFKAIAAEIFKGEISIIGTSVIVDVIRRKYSKGTTWARERLKEMIESGIVNEIPYGTQQKQYVYKGEDKAPF